MKKLLFISMLTAGVYAAHAQQGKPLLLYPEGVPNSKTAPTGYKEDIDSNRARMVTQPELIPFPAPAGKATGAAVVICPGGGYGSVVIGREGYTIARRFQAAGVSAFIVKYRLPDDRIMPDKSKGPLQDAQRALQLVRQHAAEWGLQPGKTGIIGFSAGGHLASTVGTHFAQPVINNAAQLNLRPDFMILVYPVISFTSYMHTGSRKALIGENPDSAHIKLYSNELQVTAQTPPTFLLHAQDDKVVPVQNSLLFYNALVNAGVKAEMHLYQNGGHGFGLYNKTTQDDWFERCLHWMQANGWIQ
ncbi:Acetyl esterase/lipase [Chitinophaga eiseniae]|uniref:Acetyl esterase/lipase n=1 Tax=Chitinophaga eiseniae TaxID=634771 RepID=A0A1T4TW67_9BACT|nr:alpha/beta hydrolase [Chitinophaga eiseniae]SKA44541.1 Acetyl esterase/lipase [Chitinophaga eiseniae]